MYMQDYDETFPTQRLPAGKLHRDLLLSVDPYVKNPQVPQCPSEPQAMDIVTMFSGFAGGACPGTPRYTGYSVNTACSSTASPASAPVAWRRSTWWPTR